MKRSKMLRDMEQEINNWVSNPLTSSEIEWVLSFMERQGMSPPKGTWEQEDTYLKHLKRVARDISKMSEEELDDLFQHMEVTEGECEQLERLEQMIIDFKSKGVNNEKRS